ncbi:hypothetical protein [Mesotoga sp. UBA6090]|uniref:hypothetical protein n=1 Tax=Mesotoga sp. UBA6090 TaxID=1946860 RepID=UPI0025EFF328|nr:hypothetical protein [Mesotoga sp. UBA6090]
MKNLPRSLLWFAAAVIVVFSLSSCIVVDNPVVVRVPFDELKGGAYYGGGLLFSPSNISISHLGEGTLIAFQDLSMEWTPEEGSSIAERNYGYLYIKSIDGTGIKYEYMIYDSEGAIVKRVDSVFQPVSVGSQYFSNSSDADFFSGVSYHSAAGMHDPFISDGYLLTFRHDIPDEENSAPLSFRKVLFRVQQAPMVSSTRFPRGVIAVSNSIPRSLVINSSLLVQEPSEIENQIVFSMTSSIPHFSPGDYIFDTMNDSLRRVVSVNDSDPLKVSLETEEAFVEEALGTLIVNIEGDVSEIIEKLGTESDRSFAESVTTNLITKEWEESIVDEDEMKAAIKNKLVLDANISLDFHLSWNKFSSHGTLLFPAKVSSILEIVGKEGFEIEKTKKVAEPKVSISVCGIPVTISIPIELFYGMETEVASIDLQFGPEIEVYPKFHYEVEAKINLDGPHGKSYSRGSIDHNATFVDKIDFDGSPEIEGKFGFKFYPGVTIACVLRPEMEMPVGFSARVS